MEFSVALMLILLGVLNLAGGSSLANGEIHTGEPVNGKIRSFS